MSMLTMLLQVWGKIFYLPILVLKYGRKICHQCGCGWETSPRGPYLPIDMHMPLDGGPSEAMVWTWNGVITVDRELTYPAAPHPDVWQLVFAKVPVYRGSLTLLNIASLMVLVMPSDSLPNMEKLLETKLIVQFSLESVKRPSLGSHTY